MQDQNKVKPSSKPKETIDVEKYKPKSLKLDKPWIPELGLKQSDREILLSQTAWLNDAIINAAQKLLKKANPAVRGLQDVACGLTMNFDVEPEEFVQIMYTGQEHWITVSTIGLKHAQVQAFDSLYMRVPTLAEAQIAALLNTEEPTITVSFINVQMQSGGYDCGLFSISFATALVFGEQPGYFLFEQTKMRVHLLRCLEQQQMSMFPVMKKRRTGSRVKAVQKIHIYCVCRMPDLPNSKWIECSSCKEWYHSDTCVKVAAKYLATNTLWHCAKC